MVLRGRRWKKQPARVSRKLTFPSTTLSQMNKSKESLKKFSQINMFFDAEEVNPQ
jgi:hypothetical protein